MLLPFLMRTVASKSWPTSPHMIRACPVSWMTYISLAALTMVRSVSATVSMNVLLTWKLASPLLPALVQNTMPEAKPLLDLALRRATSVIISILQLGKSRHREPETFSQPFGPRRAKTEVTAMATRPPSPRLGPFRGL